jgi:hypothetical protein
VSVAVLLGLLVALDRVAVVAAQRDVARRIQVEAQLRAAPSVTIGGFPFLTQAVAGVYDDVTVTVHHVRLGALTVASVTAHAHGAHVSLGDVIGQRLARVPIDRATGAVRLRYAALDAVLPAGLRVTASGHPHSVRVRGTFLGVRLDTTATLRVVGDGLQIGIPGAVAPTIRLAGLPFGIRLAAAHADAGGVTVSGEAHDLVLRA